MKTDQMRLALVVMLAAIIVIGGYVAWHVTHEHGPRVCYIGGARYDPCP
jgi:hypothetical protein